MDIIHRVIRLVDEHKESVDWVTPLTCARDPRCAPCYNQNSDCKTHGQDANAHPYKYGDRYSTITKGKRMKNVD